MAIVRQDGEGVKGGKMGLVADIWTIVGHRLLCYATEQQRNVPIGRHMVQEVPLTILGMSVHQWRAAILRANGWL